MNDMKISNGNPYLQTVGLQGNGKDVGQVGKTDANAGTFEKDNLSFVQGTPSRSEGTASGGNKNVLGQPRNTTHADLEGADNELSRFLEGLKPPAGQGNQPVDKSALGPEKRKANMKKQNELLTEGQAVILTYMVMSEVENVNNKTKSDAHQITAQTYIAQREAADDAAEQTLKSRSKAAQIIGLALDLGSTVVDASTNFVKDPKGVGMTPEALEKAKEAVDKKKWCLDIASKALSFGAKATKIAEITGDADRQTLITHRKQSVTALMQEAGATARYFTEKLSDRVDKTQKHIAETIKEQTEAYKNMPVTAT